MLKEWVDDHFILALLLLPVIGIAIGIIGTYVIAGLYFVWQITKYIILTSLIGGGA